MDKPAIPVWHEANCREQGAGVQRLHDMPRQAAVDLLDDSFGHLDALDGRRDELRLVVHHAVAELRPDLGRRHSGRANLGCIVTDFLLLAKLSRCSLMERSAPVIQLDAHGLVHRQHSGLAGGIFAELGDGHVGSRRRDRDDVAVILLDDFVFV